MTPRHCLRADDITKCEKKMNLFTTSFEGWKPSHDIACAMGSKWVYDPDLPKEF